MLTRDTVAVRRAAAGCLDLLASQQRTKPDLAARLGVSEMTITRALAWIAAHDVPLYYTHATYCYLLGRVPDYRGITLGYVVDSGAMLRGEALCVAMLAQASTREAFEPVVASIPGDPVDLAWSA